MPAADQQTLLAMLDHDYLANASDSTEPGY